MNPDLRKKLERLNTDFGEVGGGDVAHFYCPILFKDEHVPLCKAHIVNQAFDGAPKAWTVQRQDVDNFFGTAFESDFTALQEAAVWKEGEIFSDKKVHRKLEPKITIDGREVEHFSPSGRIPERFTSIEVTEDERPHVIGLKMKPEEMKTSLDADWAVEISKDIRLPALVSMIKAAHLTLFELHGYRYALSASGWFVGWEILGKFFYQHRGQDRARVLENAEKHFQEFVHMVRPVKSADASTQGTITSRNLLTCWASSGFPWAMIVYVKTGTALHAVMIPVFDHGDGVSTFLGFQQSSNESIAARISRFAADKWEIAKQTTGITWPKTGVLWP